MGLILFLNNGITLRLFTALFVPGIFQSEIFVFVCKREITQDF